MQNQDPFMKKDIKSVDLKQFIRSIPDFPKKGINFKDITPLLNNPSAFQAAIQNMVTPLKHLQADLVVAVEARGYLLGSAMAIALNAGIVPIRKEGKLPWHTYSIEYSLEYGSATLEIHKDAIPSGSHVILVDDLLATGGTMTAAAKLVEQSGGVIVGMAVLIELLGLGGKKALSPYNLYSLITY